MVDNWSKISYNIDLFDEIDIMDDNHEYPIEDLILAVAVYHRLQTTDLELEIGQIHPRDLGPKNLCSYLLANDRRINFPEISILEEDHLLKDKILKWSKRLIFKALDDKATGFQQACFELASKSKATLKNVGVLKFFPKMAIEQENKTRLLSDLAECDSEPVGVVGEQLSLKVKVISKKWIDKLETWSYNAITEDNKLVCWMGKDRFNYGEVREITAKVKGYQQNYHNKSLLETRLNFVR